MTTTRWAAVTDALIDAVSALSGYGTATDPDDVVRVYDGPEVDAYDEALASTYLVVGVPSDGPGSGDRSGSATETMGPMASGRPRDEAGEVDCRAVAQLGDIDSRTARAQCLAVVAAVEQVLRTDPTLGLDASWMRWASVTRHEVRQHLSSGSVCEIDFTVSFLTRLT